MNFACKFAITLLVAAASASLCFADTLATIAFRLRLQSKRPARLSRPARGKVTGKQLSCLMPTARRSLRCVATVLAYTRSIARTTKRTPVSLSKTTPALWLSVRRVRIQLRH